MRTTFDGQIRELRQGLLRMGDKTMDAIESSVTSLLTENKLQAVQVIERDASINAMKEELEQECFRLIALQQPAAGDLRQIGAVLKVVTDLERMGDHAVSIAKVTIRLSECEGVQLVSDIAKMGEIVQEMGAGALRAFDRMDQKACFDVSRMDETVDVLHKTAYGELMMRMQDDPSTIVQRTQQLFAAHHLERIGDHVTNLAEWFTYLISGKMINLNR